MDVNEFVTKQLDLLHQDHLEEVKENHQKNETIPLSTLKKKGKCITKLRISSLKTGLYGRTVVNFASKSSQDLPFNSFTSGDIIEIHDDIMKDIKEGRGGGVVLTVTNKHVTVAFDGTDVRDRLDTLQSNDSSVILLRVANEVTYRRLKQAMIDLGKYSEKHESLVEVLFGQTSPMMSSQQSDLTPFNPNLNPCQLNAVRISLAQNEVAVIHGPPGTGKTTTIVEIIAQLVKFKQKVLVCAPSNVAVDNLVEKLSKLAQGGKSPKLKLVRLGHPARIKNANLHVTSLDALVANSDSASIVQDVRSDIEKISSKLQKSRSKEEKFQLRKERKELYKELNKRENKAITEILGKADVILSTNVGSHKRGALSHLEDEDIDVVIIDECGQALEASCWIPLINKKKCILAGDHLQLPPTITSHKAAEEGLSLSLLERIVGLHGDSVVTMLTEQYRMNDVIMKWASQSLYDDKLTANDDVKSHRLRDLPYVKETEETSNIVILIDTSGCELRELRSDESDSKGNPGEGKIVLKYVTQLIEAGVLPQDVAVIAPYSLQVELLRKLLHGKYPNMEVKTVDGFQGREKEAVVLSMVRSNERGEVGFLADKRRLNVAVTRARRHLAVICDTDTVNNDEFIKSLVDYVTKHGDVRSGFEYLNSDDVEIDDVTVDKIIQPYLDSQVTSTKFNSTKQGGSKTKKSSTKPPNSSARWQKNTKAPQKIPSCEDDVGMEGRIRDVIKQFVNTNFNERHQVDELVEFCRDEMTSLRVSPEEKIIEFPPSLTALERKWVHEVCDVLGVCHVSVGQGGKRRIVVSLDKERVGTDDVIDEVTEPPQGGAPSTSGVCDVIKTMTCGKCGREIPEVNITLHLAHCERTMKLKSLIESSSNKPRNSLNRGTKKKNKTKSQIKSRKQNSGNDASDDFDVIIAEADRFNRTCFSTNCSVPTSTCGQSCQCCRKIFCLKHFLPEVHGCGDVTKVNARRQISRDGVLYQGGGVPNRSLNPEKRNLLKNKLSNKVQKMEESRKSSRQNK